MKDRTRLILVFLAVTLVSLSCVFIPQRILTADSPVTNGSSATNITTVEVEEEPVERGDLIALYERVNPGVVSIRVLRQSEEGFETGGIGTGFVWDEEGHIVTNYHVVRDVTDLEVDFPSGFKTRAKVLGSDADSDLAVLELEKIPPELTPLPLGSSRELQVGQKVVAIGNPQGLKSTMTSGIVSAVGRTMESLHEAPGGGVFSTGNIIQTDAAINPGNSGGPLLNMKGEVVGINSAIRTDSINLSGQPVNSGLGFAISVDMAKNVIPDLIEDGEHHSPYVGIRVQGEISLFMKEELNLPQSTGVYVIEVTDGSPADEGGLIGALDDDEDLRGGDLIIAIDDQEVNNFEDFMSYLLAYKKPGDEIELTVLRDHEEVTLDLSVGSRPD